MHYNNNGEELPDPNPMELPVGFVRPPTIEELFARLVLDPAAQRELQSVGIETEEEANDFDVPDEIPDPTSPYQAEGSIVTDADEMKHGFRQRLDAAALERKARAEVEAAKKILPEEKPDAKS